MRTFTQINGQSFPGLMVREFREHPTHGMGFFSYLSAELKPQQFVHVEKWDFDDAVCSEEQLRAALEAAVS